MTRDNDARRFPRSIGLALLGPFLLAVGCGSDSHAALLRLLAPEADAVLTMGDDSNTDEPGLQISVRGESLGLQVGTEIELVLDEEALPDSAEVEAGGSITFDDVTLPPGKHGIFLRALTGSPSSDPKQEYTFRALEITEPSDEQMLSLGDDQDPDQAGIQISVSLDTYAIEGTENVVLLLDGARQAGAVSPDVDEDGEGTVVFTGVTLSAGEHTLAAEVEDDADVAAAEIDVRVREACAEIDFLSPKPPAAGATRLDLGGADACPTDTGDPFEISVQVSTDAGDGQQIELFVNDMPMPVASGEVQGSSITFDGVALTNLSSANRLRVEVTNAEGVTCAEDFPADIFVDCAGPDCTLTGPIPVDFLDANDKETRFLNAAHERKGGFDVEIETDQPGQTVSLIIDGDPREAIDETATKQGSSAVANFAGVKLDEGPHTLEGRCEDAAGNVNFTGELSVVVDTIACAVEVTEPDADTLFVPADDDDATPANGTQAVVTSTVTGGDCVAQRAAPCDPADGLANPDFVPYDGASPLSSTLTLDADLLDQTLCVEIEDRASNVGLGTLDVRFRSIPPTLEFESPSDGETFNALGNAGHTADADGSSGSCDADFSVACTEVGEPVDLHLDDAMGTVFATTTCVAPGPAGFAGRAEITKAFDIAGDTAVIVATQDVEGDSGEPLVGSSASITISGDCVAPTPALQGDPCEGGVIGVVGPTDTVTKNVVVLAGAGDATSVTLSVDNTDTTMSSDSTPDNVVGPQNTFNSVLFGGVGMVTLTADVIDDFDNAGTTTCTATIIEDVPALSVTAPTDSQAFGPGDGCNAGAGVFGVQVTAMTDTDVNRIATISVNGGSATSVGVGGGGAISACVAVPDDVDNAGPSSITVHVESTASGGFREITRTVSVSTVAITDPADNQVLVAADDCGGAGFAYQVAADVDAVHVGSSYVIESATSGTMLMGVVAGGSITGCLDLGEGPQVISVSIDGTEYTSVDVVVANMAPGTEIVLTPTCPDPADATYRRDPVNLDWNDLASLEDWPGQFVSYTLRCAHTPVADAATPADWWTTVATDVALGSPPIAPQSGMTAADIPYRVGETRYCALRAADAGGQLTPILGDADVTCAFREVVLFASVTDLTIVGTDSAAIGDVNGDAIDDILVGGSGRAYLFFGSTDATALDDGPDVTFTAPATMGIRVAGLGDFNGDGRQDFAIAWPNHNSTRGQVFVFFGRLMSNPWPALPVDLSVTCGADLCIKHSTAAARLGNALSAAGDFDGDGNSDLAAGAANCTTGSATTGQVFVFRGSDYEARSCTDNTECRATETCAGAPTGTCELMAGQNFWGLDYDALTGNWLNAPTGTPTTLLGFRIDGDAASASRFGCGLAAFGAFDTTAGHDLVVSAPGCTGVTANCPATRMANLYFLSGHGYVGPGPGIQTLAFAELGFRDGGGVPSGTPFESGQAVDFGLPIAVAGNVYDLPSAGNPGTHDLLVKRTGADEFFIYPGDTNFLPADRIQVTDSGSTDIGIHLAAGFHPTLPDHPMFPTPELLGDIDGDGLVDLCASSRFVVNPTPPGAVFLWYSDVVDASAGDGVMTYAEASRIEPAAATATQYRVVRYVGDINGDDDPDILVGDFEAAPSGSLRGRATLLY